MRALPWRLSALFCVSLAVAALGLVGCADGGGLAPREGKPRLVAEDAGSPAGDAGWPEADAGFPPSYDAGTPFDAGAPPAGATGCGAIGLEGDCLGSVARWCDGDAIGEYDCASDGLECAWIEEEAAFGCTGGAPAEPPPATPPAEDGCGDIDYLGDCQGLVVRWCDGGELSYHDCSTDGLRCGWVDDATGYWCVP